MSPFGSVFRAAPEDDGAAIERMASSARLTSHREFELGREVQLMTSGEGKTGRSRKTVGGSSRGSTRLRVAPDGRLP